MCYIHKVFALNAFLIGFHIRRWWVELVPLLSGKGKWARECKKWLIWLTVCEGARVCVCVYTYVCTYVLPWCTMFHVGVCADAVPEALGLSSTWSTCALACYASTCTKCHCISLIICTMIQNYVYSEKHWLIIKWNISHMYIYVHMNTAHIRTYVYMYVYRHTVHETAPHPTHVHTHAHLWSMIFHGCLNIKLVAVVVCYRDNTSVGRECCWIGPVEAGADGTAAQASVCQGRERHLEGEAGSSCTI